MGMMNMDSNLNLVSNIFSGRKVLLLYYSGSKAYGYDDENSDIDLTVVLEGFKGNMHLQLGKIDIFAFSKEEYIKRQNFDDSIIDYYKSAADDILVSEDKVIYLDSKFCDEYKKLKNIEVKQFIVNQLSALINYTKMRMDINMKFKSHYHLFRMRGMIDHYDKTGKYELVFEEPWFTKMMNFKKNWDKDIAQTYAEEIKQQLKYLENYRNEMIDCGLE